MEDGNAAADAMDPPGAENLGERFAWEPTVLLPPVAGSVCAAVEPVCVEDEAEPIAEDPCAGDEGDSVPAEGDGGSTADPKGDAGAGEASAAGGLPSCSAPVGSSVVCMK